MRRWPSEHHEVIAKTHFLFFFVKENFKSVRIFFLVTWGGPGPPGNGGGLHEAGFYRRVFPSGIQYPWPPGRAAAHGQPPEAWLLPLSVRSCSQRAVFSTWAVTSAQPFWSQDRYGSPGSPASTGTAVGYHPPRCHPSPDGSVSSGP